MTVVPRIASLAGCSTRTVAALMSHAYRDYVVPVRFTTDAAVAMLREDSIDLAASKQLRLAGRRAGLALVARRGRSSRLAALAVVPERRRGGLGRELLERVLGEARERGDREMALEVIENNAPAVRLYLEAGFEVRRRLLQFDRREDVAAPEGPAPEVATAVALGTAVDRHGLPDLPWQVSGITLAQTIVPVEPWRLGDAWAAVDVGVPSRLRLRALVVDEGARGRGAARSLLDGIERAHRGRPWFVAAHCPAELEEPMRHLGFVRGPDSLVQLQMVRRFV